MEESEEPSMSKLHFLLEYRHHMDKQMSRPEYSHKREQEEDYQYPTKDSYEILADNSSEQMEQLSETHENDMFDKPMGGPDLLTDELIEEVLAREPHKVTPLCLILDGNHRSLFHL